LASYLPAGRKTRFADEQSTAAATVAARAALVPAASLKRISVPTWPSSARRRRFPMSSVPHVGVGGVGASVAVGAGVAVGTTVGARVDGTTKSCESPGP